MDAHEAFYEAWGAPVHQVGHSMILQGVPHWHRGQYVESVPIRVLKGAGVAFVDVERDA